MNRRVLLGLAAAACLATALAARKPSPKPADPKAPATQCQLCHADVEHGFKATRHAAANHSCQTCHGRSTEHSWSEDGHVKPDKPLRERGPADKLCLSCHEKPKHTPALDIDRRCSLCHRPHPKRKKAEPDANPTPTPAPAANAQLSQVLARAAAEIDKHFKEAKAGLDDGYAVPTNFLAYQLRRHATALAKHKPGAHQKRLAALITTLNKAADGIRAELKTRTKNGRLAKDDWLQPWHKAVRAELAKLRQRGVKF